MTHFGVDPVGLGISGEKITKIMSEMCMIEEAQSIITDASDKIVNEMLATKNIEPQLVCVVQRKDYNWDFYLYFFTCEKKRFKKKDLTLIFVHRGGHLHNKLISNDLIRLSNFLAMAPAMTKVAVILPENLPPPLKSLNPPCFIKAV